MNNKPLNPLVGIVIGAVALVLILVMGYKFFLAPAPLPPEPNASAQYPGGHAAGSPVTTPP